MMSVLCWSCTVQYKLNMASIDYTKIKTISIADFPNRAPLVYPSLSQSFSEGLRNKFLSQTKLKNAKRDGHLQLEGDIIAYELTPMAQGSDGYAKETKLTITVQVRYTNTVNENENFDQKLSAYRTFPSSVTFESVQETLVDEIIKEISDLVFNKTVANW